MKKRFFWLALVCVMPLVLSACSSQLPNSQDTQSSNQDGQFDENKNSVPGNFRQPDFGQPEREADIRGVVKSIVGNEVVVLKMDMNARQGLRGTSTTESLGEANQSPTISLTGMANSGQGGRKMAGGPGGMTGGGPGGERGVNSADRASMLEALKEMSAGEETLIIPVGIQMLKNDTTSTDSRKREMVAATLEDVKADKMITIWLNESISDRQVAEFIMIN